MRRRRRRLKMASLTPMARQLWPLCYRGEPFPKGWRVEWAGFMRGALGLTLYSERRILLSYGDRKKRNPIRTLAHEFVHVRTNGKLRHGKEFSDLVERNIRLMWGLS